MRYLTIALLSVALLGCQTTRTAVKPRPSVTPIKQGLVDQRATLIDAGTYAGKTAANIDQAIALADQLEKLLKATPTVITK